MMHFASFASTNFYRGIDPTIVRARYTVAAWYASLCLSFFISFFLFLSLFFASFTFSLRKKIAIWSDRERVFLIFNVHLIVRI